MFAVDRRFYIVNQNEQVHLIVREEMQTNKIISSFVCGKKKPTWEEISAFILVTFALHVG